MNWSREKIFQYALFTLVFFIPVYQSLSIKLLILVAVLSLVLVRNLRWKREMVRNGGDLLLYFAILALGMLYTEDKESGWGVLEKNLSFIVVPLIFSRIETFDKTLVNRIFTFFTIGVLTASVLCLAYAIWRDFYMDYPNGYFYDQFTGIIESHPTYMAYYVCFSIIFLLYLISYEIVGRLKKTFILLAIVFLSFVLMLTAGRSTFVSMLMMASFFFLKLLFEPHPLKRKIQGISITVLLLLIILLQSPYSKKVLPNFPNGRSASIEQIRGDSWERLELWKSALEASSNIFTGVGTGDYSRVMNDYYNSHGMSVYAELSFNAHNQFIQILFSNGVAGLLALAFMIMRPILMSVRRQNIFGMLTFFPFLIYGISEVFLGRYQGIIFFVLLHQVFIKYFNHNNERISIRNL